MIKKKIFFVSLFLGIILNIILDININNYIKILEKCFNQNIFIDNKIYASICFINALISILIIVCIKLIVENKQDEIKGFRLKSDDATFGTANWMNEKEIKGTLSMEDVPGIILGKKNDKIIKLPFNNFFNKNIAVFGSSGSMKTRGFVMTNILELSKTKSSMIFTDPKAEIYRETADFLKRKGYTIKVFNLKDMIHSDRWNPLAENESITDVQTSADVIIANTQLHTRGSDDFWPRAEENLLKAFEFYFLENKLEENTLKDIYFNIASGDVSKIDELFRKLPQDSPARMSYNIFASGSDTIKASVLTGLGTRLQIFQNKHVQELTSHSDIDLTLPGKKPCAYYCITSDMNSDMDFLISLFFTFLFLKLVRYADSMPNGKCENKVFFWLDEFANIGAIPDFNKKISTVRSRDISLIPIVQNVGQIKNRYPNDVWQEIVRKL